MILAKRKLSAYNLFIQKYKKIDPSLSFTEISKEWAKEKESCPTCYAPVASNPGKKATSKTKKPKTTTKKTSKQGVVLVEDKPVLAPFIVGSAIGGVTGYATRSYNQELPLPAPFNNLSVTAPSGVAVVGGILTLISDHKALGVGLLIGGGVSAFLNYLEIQRVVAKARRRALSRRPVAQRLVAKAPVPTVKQPMFTATSRVGANGSDQRPIKSGLPLQSGTRSDVPIRKAGFIHGQKMGCDGNTRPSDLPVRYPDKNYRIEATPTYESGIVFLA